MFTSRCLHRFIILYLSALLLFRLFFCFNDTATPEIYPYGHNLCLRGALPISEMASEMAGGPMRPKWASPPTGNAHHFGRQFRTVRTSELAPCRGPPHD